MDLLALLSPISRASGGRKLSSVSIVSLMLQKLEMDHKQNNYAHT